MIIIVFALIMAAVVTAAVWFDYRFGRRFGWLGITVMGAALAAVGFRSGWENGVYGAFVAIVMVAVTLVVYAMATAWRHNERLRNRV
jgi:multisubunit Na+/H+ antiporter MnhB subunit